MTRSGDRLQEEIAGTAVRETLPWLAFASRTIPVALGIHLNESWAIPVPEAAEKVIVIGLVPQVAFGALLAAIPTPAKAPTIMRLIDTPTRIWGRYRLIRDSNCKSVDQS